MYSVEDMLTTRQLISYAERVTNSYNLLAGLFPTIKTTAEELIISDYDIDYDVSALPAAENTEARPAQRPTFHKRVQDLMTYKLEYRLTDKQIRLLNSPSNGPEQEEIIKNVFDDVRRLVVSQQIARERIRAQLLLTGKIEINENGYNPEPIDWGLPTDQLVDFDFEKDDFMEFVYHFNELLSQRDQPALARMIISRSLEFKLRRNPSIKDAFSDYRYESSGKRPLTTNELKDVFQDQIGVEYQIIENPDRSLYGYRMPNETQEVAKTPFIPNDKCILLPSGPIGNTVNGITAEELKMREQEGITVTNTDNGILFANYEPRPINYVITSVSRFTVTAPKAKRTVVATDKSGAAWKAVSLSARTARKVAAAPQSDQTTAEKK